ncbi:MAG: translocation/assembly module TamB domain-containing protein [Candidatus Glassbacteria bacterium]
MKSLEQILHALKRPFLILGRFLLLLVVALIVLVYVFYKTNRRELAMLFSYWVEMQTPRLFAPEVRFSRVETTTLGHFIFYDFEITDPFEPDRLCLKSGEVEVSFDPLQLLWRGGITLSKLNIHQGDFWIHKENGDGPVNLNRIFKPGSGGGGGDGVSLRIRRFLLEDCHVRLEDIDKQPIDNLVNYLDGRYTKIGGENIIEVYGSSLETSYWSLGSCKLTGIFTIEGDVLSLRKTRVLKGGTDLTGDGFVDFNSRKFEIKLRPGTLEMAHLPPELGMRDYLSGTAEISVTFDGTFDSTAVTADISFPRADIFYQHPEDFSCRLRYTAGVLGFEKVSAAIWDGRLTDGRMEFRFRGENPGYSVQARASRIDLTRLGVSAFAKLDAHLSGEFRFQGSGYTGDDLQLRGSLLSASGRLEGTQVDSADGEFSYDDRKLKIDNLAVYFGQAAATAIGDMDFNVNDLFLFVTVERMPGERVVRYLPVDTLAGTCDFSGTFSGNPSDPEMRGSFTILDGYLLGIEFARLEGICQLNSLFERPDGTAEVGIRGITLRDAHFDSLGIKAEIPEPGMVFFTPMVVVFDSTASATATGTYIGLADGSPATVYFDSLLVAFRGEEARTETRTRLELNGDSLSVEKADLDLFGGTLTGSLQYSLNGRIKADADFAGIDVSRVSKLLDSGFEVGGTLDGKFEVEGPSAELEGHLQVTVDSARFAPLRADKLTVQARLSAGMLEVERLELSKEGAHCLASGRLPVELITQPRESGRLSDHQLSLEAVLSKFPLSAIKTVNVPLTAGTFGGRITLTGSPAAPVLQGELALEGGTGVIAPINLRLNNMKGRAIFSPGLVEFEKIESVSPEGLISLSGRMPLKGFRPKSIELQVTGRDMIMQQFRDVTSLKLNADLTVSGPLDAPVMRGNVELVEGEVNPLIGAVSGITGGESLSSQEEVKLPLSPIDYDLTFRAINNFWLRNRNANIKLTASLRAVQTDSVPQVTGQITTVAGYYSLFGRRFRIRYGSIQFQGQSSLNPLLDINAERDVRGKVLRSDLAGAVLGSRSSSGPSIPGEQYEVDRNTFYLHIGGTLNSPQFEITVRDREDREIEPPLTEEQARTLVIFDETYREFQQQSSYSQSKFLDQAANLALNQANPYLQELTGFDEFSFESQLFNRGNDQSQSGERASAKVTMGEFLFESIFFSISQDIIDPSARSAQIEYLIDRNSSIISQTDSRGHFSVDYRYRIRY